MTGPCTRPSPQVRKSIREALEDRARIESGSQTSLNVRATDLVARTAAAGLATGLGLFWLWAGPAIAAGLPFAAAVVEGLTWRRARRRVDEPLRLPWRVHALAFALCAIAIAAVGALLVASVGSEFARTTVFFVTVLTLLAMTLGQLLLFDLVWPPAYQAANPPERAVRLASFLVANNFALAAKFARLCRVLSPRRGAYRCRTCGTDRRFPQVADKAERTSAWPSADAPLILVKAGIPLTQTVSLEAWLDASKDLQFKLPDCPMGSACGNPKDRVPSFLVVALTARRADEALLDAMKRRARSKGWSVTVAPGTGGSTAIQFEKDGVELRCDIKAVTDGFTRTSVIAYDGVVFVVTGGDGRRYGATAREEYLHLVELAVSVPQVRDIASEKPSLLHRWTCHIFEDSPSDRIDLAADTQRMTTLLVAPPDFDVDGIGVRRSMDRVSKPEKVFDSLEERAPSLI